MGNPSDAEVMQALLDVERQMGEPTMMPGTTITVNTQAISVRITFNDKDTKPTVEITGAGFNQRIVDSKHQEYVERFAEVVNGGWFSMTLLLEAAGLISMEVLEQEPLTG